MMKVIKISPRGYCYGVADAMVIARNAGMDKNLPRPIYILGMLVHNEHVTKAFEEEQIFTVDGPNRLEILEKIDKGTVIFTAHGISPEVKKRAIEKGLTCLDASCPDVLRTHDLIRHKVAEGYDIIYIGKKGHPEPEGAIGVAPNHVHLVQTLDDLNHLNLSQQEKLIVTNQTTMSQWDVQDLAQSLIDLFPNIEFHKEICLATQVRQEAVAEQAQAADLLIVVGDPRSNNSNRLAQVSIDIAKTTAYRIGSIEDIDLNWLKGIETVAVTSGASTPTIVTKEVIKFLEKFDENDPTTHDQQSKIVLSKILPKPKKQLKKETL